jgi:phosphatidate cytidylyltransferase
LSVRGGAPRDGSTDTSFAANLARRLATAALTLPPLAAALLVGPPWLTVAIVAAALGVGTAELFRLLEARALPPHRVAGALATTAFFVDAGYPGHAGPPLWPVATVLLLCAALQRAARHEAAIPAAGASLLGALYLGGLGGTIAGLRVGDPGQGGWRVVLLLAVVMGADTFAYFTGRAAGRTPLAPSLSPKKTVEGALGGIAGGIAGALVVRALGLPGLPPWHAVGLGAAAAALGTAGDLFESALKRWAGVKDSGTLFPGHGGMLDRLDSLLFAAPVLYYYFLPAR